MKKLSALIISAALSTAALSAADIATYPGGEEAMQKYIESHMQYPETSKQNGIEGVVNVECTIKTDGSIGTIKIVRMVGPDLEQEAIRLVKNMPAWTPATKNGAPAESTVTIPVTFTLPE